MGDFSGESLRLAILNSSKKQTEVAKHMGISLQHMQSFYKAKHVKADLWNKIMDFIGKKEPSSYFDDVKDDTFRVVNEPEYKPYAKSNVVEQLIQLVKLKENGHITSVEYETVKKRIIGDYN